MTRAIEDHGVIGDLRSVALVATDATIDFLCWPRFDSPSVFAAILDEERGGAFALAPVLDGARLRQLYLPDTNVLLTRFMAEGGLAEICDFMVLGDGGGKRLVRRAKAVRGEVRFRLRCAPRFDYGRAGHTLEIGTDGAAFRPDGGATGALRLRAGVPLRDDGGDAVAEFTLGEGRSAAFLLEDADGEASIEDGYVADAFKKTINTWRDWAGRCRYRGRWRDAVVRSALALKLMTCADSGAMVAAPTFGLPETPGGSRNWDYRYTWVRDAAFTAYAFLRIGYTQEAQEFVGWLLEVAERGGNADGAAPIMFGLDGAAPVPEEELPHLRGHGGASPVRIGNAAATQTQLDIYGELMDAIYLADKYTAGISFQDWRRVTRGMDYIAAHWNEPDAGIWEMRGPPRHFLHSRVMAWVALDRAVRLAQKRGLPAPLARWIAERDAIHADVHDRFWNEAKGAFVQSLDGDALDAAALLMPLVRFIAPTDPRWRSTLRAIGHELAEDSLVHRYSTADGADGLDDCEGTFSMCSFWYVECIARAGDLQRARFLFEKMLSYGNHLGLFAEEIGRSGEHLGNFPQALTHLALISAAFYLDRALSEAG